MKRSHCVHKPAPREKDPDSRCLVDDKYKLDSLARASGQVSSSRQTLSPITKMRTGFCLLNSVVYAFQVAIHPAQNDFVVVHGSGFTKVPLACFGAFQFAVGPSADDGSRLADLFGSCVRQAAR